MLAQVTAVCAVQAPVECPQVIGDLIEDCLSMDPCSRPSARDVFDIISKAQAAQDEQATQDPWDSEEGPPLQASSASV